MKKGFTLAEVLITLGIIGVIAALTAPGLVRDSGNAKIGPTLAKFVNTWETSVEKYLVEQGLPSLTTGNSTGTPTSGLAKHMIMVPGPAYHSVNTATGEYITTVISQITETKYSANGTSYEALVSYADECWQLKDGSIFIIKRYNNPVNLNNMSAYTAIIAEVIYDINGDRGPNRAGKDEFCFLLDRSGTLIPAGSRAHKYINIGEQRFTNSAVDCNPTANNIAQNFACTGKIADNGWSADY